jgi:DNA-binding transcriptional MerR regulator
MKTREAFPSVLLIGQFAKLSGLSSRMLRFYAERNILVPAFTDNATGYRYYLPSQLIEAQLLRRLRQADFSLDDIAVILNGLETAQWGECVAAQRESITRKIAAMKMALEELEHLEKHRGPEECVLARFAPVRVLSAPLAGERLRLREIARTEAKRLFGEDGANAPLFCLYDLHEGPARSTICIPAEEPSGDYAGMRAGRLAPQRNVRDGSGNSGAASCVGKQNEFRTKGRVLERYFQAGRKITPTEGWRSPSPWREHLFPRPERGIFLNGAVPSSAAGRNRSPMACAVPAADE